MTVILKVFIGDQKEDHVFTEEGSLPVYIASSNVREKIRKKFGKKTRFHIYEIIKQ